MLLCWSPCWTTRHSRALSAMMVLAKSRQLPHDLSRTEAGIPINCTLDPGPLTAGATKGRGEIDTPIARPGGCKVPIARKLQRSRARMENRRHHPTADLAPSDGVARGSQFRKCGPAATHIPSDQLGPAVLAVQIMKSSGNSFLPICHRCRSLSVQKIRSSGNRYSPIRYRG